MNGVKNSVNDIVGRSFSQKDDWVGGFGPSKAYPPYRNSTDRTEARSNKQSRQCRSQEWSVASTTPTEHLSVCVCVCVESMVVYNGTPSPFRLANIISPLNTLGHAMCVCNKFNCASFYYSVRNENARTENQEWRIRMNWVNVRAYGHIIRTHKH